MGATSMVVHRVPVFGRLGGIGRTTIHPSTGPNPQQSSVSFQCLGDLPRRFVSRSLASSRMCWT